MTQKNDVRIVSLEKRHIVQMAELERTCFSSPWTEAMILEEMENPCALYRVAEMDERMVGYIGVQIILDEGYITNVAVAPEMRRCGIGRQLLETLISEIKGKKLSFVTLEVRAGNAPAIALYEGFGFQEVGIRRNYYTLPTEDAILMTKWLTN